MGSTGKTTATQSWENRTVRELADAFKGTADEVRARWGEALAYTSDDQLYALKRIMLDIANYDTSYDEAKTPYKISMLSITPIGVRSEEDKAESRKWGRRPGKYSPVMVQMYTKPDTDSALLRIMDEKSHAFTIGVRGGITSVGIHSKKLTEFEAAYGKRTFNGGK